MRRIFISLIGLLLAVAVHAQNHSTRPAENKTTQSKPVQTVANFAIYSTETTIQTIAESDKYLYLLERGEFSSENNAVLFIDKETGECGTVIKGYAGIYEGARPRITNIVCTPDNRLYFEMGEPAEGMTGAPKSRNLYLFDGKSVETSKPAFDRPATDAEISPNGEFLRCYFYQNGNPIAIIYNLKTEKIVRRYNDPNRNYSHIDDKGTLWNWSRSSCLPLGEKEWKKLEINGKELYLGLKADRITYFHDGHIYYPVNRRVYRVSIDAPTVVNEFAKVPPTERWGFRHVVMNKKGIMLGESDEGDLILFRPGQFDNPLVARSIDTQIAELGMYSTGNYSLYFIEDIMVDSRDNFLCLQGSVLYIYNPDNLTGYQAGRRKYSNIEKNANFKPSVATPPAPAQWPEPQVAPSSTSKADKIEVDCPKTAKVGENFKICFKVDGDDAKDIQLSQSGDFEVVIGPSRSQMSNFRKTNGQTSQSTSVTFTYSLTPKSVGTKAIPVAVIKVGDKTLVSESGVIEILAEGEGKDTETSKRNADDISDEDLFMTATLSRAKVEVGGTLQLTLRLYSSVNVTQLENNGTLDLDNCHCKESDLPQQKEFSMESYNGKNLRSVIWQRYIITPLKEGKFTVPSREFEATVLVRDTNVNATDAFFNPDSSMKEVKKTIKSPAVEFEVLPKQR